MQNLLNKEFNVKAIGINNYGKGVVKLDSLLCFVDDLYPEEEALIRIVKQEKNLVYGKVINITKKSPHRIDSICKHSDDLGSCPFNNIDYEYELELKGNIIKNNLERALKFEIGHIDVISGDVIDGYRNKVTVFFSLDTHTTRVQTNLQLQLDQ